MISPCDLGSLATWYLGWQVSQEIEPEEYIVAFDLVPEVLQGTSATFYSVSRTLTPFWLSNARFLRKHIRLEVMLQPCLENPKVLLGFLSAVYIFNIVVILNMHF